MPHWTGSTVRIQPDAPSSHTKIHTQTDKTKHQLSHSHLHFPFPIFPSLQWWRTAILGSTSFRFVSLKIISFFLQNLCLKASNSTPLSCVVSRVSSGFWRSHGRMQLCWTRIGLFTGLDFLIFARQFQSKAVKWYFCQEIPSQKWTLFPFFGSFCSWVFSLFDC